jgi:sugar lactone lactonase YvrE
MQINRITPACRELASGLQFPEGPIALPDGSVIVVEMRRQTLSRVTPVGQVEIVAELGGGPNGAALGPDGQIYVTNNGGPGWIVDAEGNSLPVGQADDNHGGSIQRVEPRTGKVETLYDRCDGRPIGAPNDLVFDDHGGFWFTDFGKYSADGGAAAGADSGGVYYARADGSLIERKIFPLDHPNGIGLSPDDKRLYVAETPTARCLAYDLDAPGALTAGPGPFSDRGPRRAPVLRFPGGGWHGAYLRRHHRPRRRERHLAGRQPGRPVPAARPDRDQCLLRRPGARHRVRHPFPARQAGRLRLAATGRSVEAPQSPLTPQRSTRSSASDLRLSMLNRPA